MNFIRRFSFDCGGNISVLGSIMLVSLVGVTGLVTEYGNGLLNRMEDQRTADAAAMAGATIYSQTNSSSSMNSAINDVASLNGTSGSSVAASLVSSPTGDGNQAVQVTVSSNVPLLFSRLIQPSKSVLPVQATSYAEIQPGLPSCIIALNNSGTGVSVSGGAAVTAQNCTISSNQSITCSGGGSVTADYLFYDSAALNCTSVKNSTGGTPNEKQRLTPDPLGSTAAVQNQTARFSTVDAMNSPSAPSTQSGLTNLAFPSSGSLNVGMQGALSSQGCSDSFYSGTWTVTCPAGGSYQFGTISVTGSVTVNFNTSGSASNTYYFTQIATGAGTLNFGPGTYNVPQGIVTTNGSAVTTFGAGTFNIGASSSVSCNSSNSYSICNTGPTMTFAGPSTFVLAGGIYAKGTVTLGSSGTTNSFNIGKAADGNSLYMAGSANVSFGDATGAGDVFQLAGNMNDPNGGTCLKVSAATYHDVNGYFLTAGGNILGSGIYTIADYMSLGGSNGGNVTCWGTSTGVLANNVTFVINGNVLDSSGHAFYVGAGYSTVTITAPTTGSTANLAVVGPTSTSNTGTAVFTEGASNTSVSGAFYFPNGAVSLSGAASLGNGAGQCLELIGSQISMSGGSSLGSICQVPGATNDSQRLVSLVQ